MRDLTRKEKCAVAAMVNAVEHEPALRPVLVEDYAGSRLQIRDLRTVRDTLERRLRTMTRHPEEPGSQSTVGYRDGLAPYGSPDHTGFGEAGCVY